MRGPGETVTETDTETLPRPAEAGSIP